VARPSSQENLLKIEANRRGRGGGSREKEVREKRKIPLKKRKVGCQEKEKKFIGNFVSLSRNVGREIRGMIQEIQ